MYVLVKNMNLMESSKKMKLQTAGKIARKRNCVLQRAQGGRMVGGLTWGSHLSLVGSPRTDR